MMVLTDQSEEKKKKIEEEMCKIQLNFTLFFLLAIWIKEAFRLHFLLL